MSDAQQSNESADYVIVGAGAAGAALSARLSEGGHHKVVLLEAGGSDRAQAVNVPAAFSQNFKTERDWDYQTTRQPALENRSIYWPRGRMLGGSTSMNALMWVRGFAQDYDRWAELAGTDWSFDALLPYFRRVEHVAGSDDPDHGTAGAIQIQPLRDPLPLTRAFLDAAEEAGHVVEAANGRTPAGFSQTMVTMDRGARSSAAGGYLKPARSRPNLVVHTGAHATRVLFEGTRAVGVEFEQDGQLRTCRAGREVVLCGGAINTPQLLQVSGIGDPDLLRSHGIDVLVDAPDVGRHLRDHLVGSLVAEVEGGTLLDVTSPRALASYLLRRRGMLTSNVAEAYGFLRVGDGPGLPDIEVLFAPCAYVDEGLNGIPSHGITVGAILLQPESSGVVEITSRDPRKKASIDPRYLSDPDGRDLEILTAGLEACGELLAAPSLKAHTTGRFVRPLGGERMSPEDRVRAAITRHAHTLYHPVGTARMGTDGASVVDPQLRVRGVEGLRVADASIMPQIIRGHTNAPSIVIGEKAADLIAGSGADHAPTVSHSVAAAASAHP